MLEKLVSVRKAVMVVFAAIMLACSGVFAVFYTGDENKILVFLAPLIFPVIFYGFILLAFRVLEIAGTKKTLTVFAYIILIVSSVPALIFAVISCISSFGQALPPTAFAAFGLFSGVLSAASRFLRKE